MSELTVLSGSWAFASLVFAALVATLVALWVVEESKDDDFFE